MPAHASADLLVTLTLINQALERAISFGRHCALRHSFPFVSRSLILFSIFNFRCRVCLRRPTHRITYLFMISCRLNLVVNTEYFCTTKLSTGCKLIYMYVRQSENCKAFRSRKKYQLNKTKPKAKQKKAN